MTAITFIIYIVYQNWYTNIMPFPETAKLFAKNQSYECVSPLMYC